MSTAHATETRPGRRHTRTAILAAIALAVAVLFAVATGWLGRHEVTPASPTDAAAAAVQWQDYRPGFQAELGAADCEQLATAYTAAATADETMRQYHGHGSDAIAAYIVAVATDKGCTWQP